MSVPYRLRHENAAAAARRQAAGTGRQARLLFRARPRSQNDFDNYFFDNYFPQAVCCVRRLQAELKDFPRMA